MFNNPLTPQDLLTLASASAEQKLGGLNLPEKYVYATPVTGSGFPAWRLFDAAYISTGIIDPNRLGSGATGAGNLYLADDQTWKPVSSIPGSQNLQQVTDLGNITTNTIDTAGTKSDYFLLDTLATPTLQAGMFAWSDAEGTANLRLKGNNVTLQVGQETLARVVNKTGADLLESQYKVVRVRVASEGGSQGQRLAVVLAQGDNDPDSATTLGLVTENIANNQEGFITVFGNVNGINTTGSLQGETWVDGDVLYLSPTTPGGLTKVKPVAPQHTVIVGYVLYAHGVNGKIFVKVDNGYELDELHNVLITSPANNDLLQYNSTQQVWKNIPVATAVPTPTLAQVTTAGNTTTNAILAAQFQINGTTRNARLSSDNVGGFDINYNIGGTPDWRWFGGGTTALTTFKANGNVLIGTTTDAGYKLDVIGTARVQSSASNAVVTGLRLANSAAASVTAGQGVQLDFANDSGFALSLSSSTIRSITTNTANGAADLLFLNYSGSALTEYMRITRLGNVGIGTTNPSAKLHVAGTVQIGTTADASFSLRLTRTSVGVPQDAHFYAPTNNSPAVFYIEGGYYTGEAVGTATAALNGYPYYEKYFGNGSSASYKHLGFINVANGSFGNTNLIPSIALLSTGNVGIGTTSPAYRVDVQGTTLATSSVSVQGAFNINPLAAPPAIGGFTLSAGTNLGVGTYYYFVVYVTALGETSAGANLTVVTTTGNTTVNLTGIPVSSDPRVTARKLYRTLVGQTSDAHRFLATISDNVTTTYTDSATDASLTGVALQYYKVNTTSRYFTVAGVQGMVIDTNLTALGRNAGGNIISTSGAAIRTVLIGAQAGQSITTGQANVIVGVAGASITTGSNNTLIGDIAGYGITTGYDNTFLGGDGVGRYVTTGYRNTFIGNQAGRNLNDGTSQFTVGFENIAIGNRARMFANNNSNSIVIGSNALGLGTNTTVLGNSSTTFTSIPAGNLAVGSTTNAGYKLDVNGTLRTVNSAYFATSSGTVSIGTTTTPFKFTLIDGSATYVAQFRGSNSSYIIAGDTSLAGESGLNARNSVGQLFLGISPSAEAYFSGTGGATALNFSLAGVSRIYVNSSGNVGIGTTSPSFPLHVVGRIYSITSGTDGGQIRLANNGGGSTWYWAARTTGLNLGELGSADGRIFIANGGNVGIGTTSPSYRLVVNKTSISAPAIMIGGAFYGGPRLQVYGLDADNNAWMGLGTDMGVGSYEHSIYYPAQAGSGKVTFGTYNGTTYSTKMLLNQAGNLLIGTTTDAGYKLDVNGTLRVQSITAGTANYNRFLVSDSGAVKYRVASEMLSDIDVPGYVSSRGENLVTNGTGLRKSNYNFSQFTFVGSEAYYSTGSFRDTVYSSAPVTDEAIPVDVNQRYRLTVSARQNPYVGARYYVGVSLIDADGYPVQAPNHMYKANTLTTLAAQLNPGDTVVYLTSAANWENGGTAGVNTHIRSFIFWNYVNSLGYAFPALTYSRNWYGNMWDPGSVNTTTNTITLRVPWAGPIITAGTQLSNGNSGGTYKYITAANVQIPNAWTTYSGIIQGVDTTGTNVTDKFAPGTAAIKILFLNNRDVAGATVYYTNVQFGLDLVNPNTHILNGTSLQTANFNISGNGYLGGNLGVGTTTPQAKLDVNGTFNLLGGVGGYWLKGVQGNSTVNSNNPFLALVNNNTIASATYGWLFYDSDADGSFNLYRRNNSTTGNQVFTISRSTGNFLINTSTDAGFKLDVVGSERLQVNSLTNTVATGGLTLANTTAATSGVTQQNSPSVIFSGSAWVSGALKTHDIAIQSEPQTWDSTRMIWYKRLNSGSWLPFFGLRSDSTGQNSLFLYPVGYLKDGVGQAHSAGFTISNGSQATAILQQFSPAFMVQGYGWNGTSSVLTSSSWLFAPEAGTTSYQGVSKFVYNESLNNELIRYEFGERLGMWVNKLSLANYTTTINSRTTITGSITAASAIARGTYLNQTLVAAANNDTLVGLDINPTFTTGAFTGVTRTALRVQGILHVGNYASSVGGRADIGQSITTVVNNSATVVTSSAGTSLHIENADTTTNSYVNVGLRVDVTGNAVYSNISLIKTAASTGILRIHQQGVQQFALYSTGNLVLQNGGTFTDAGYRLDVNGTARVQSNFIVDTDTLVVDATNNRVGIGIASPTDKLHIVDSSNANIFGRITATGTNASAAWVAVNNQNDNVVYRVFGDGVSGSQMGISLVRSASLLANLGGSGKFLLGTFSATDFVMGTGNAEKMRIVNSTGNILIGTTSDNGNKLQVAGTVDGQMFAANGINGWTGTIMIMTNPPGMQNIQVDSGIITNVF